jgi:hypothetical protein
MAGKVLDADTFRGVKAAWGRDPSPAEMADLEAGYRDAMKTALAEQGKSIQPDVLSMVKGGGFAERSLTDTLGQMQEVLKQLSPDLTKDWSLTSPLSQGLVPYDLQAPSKKLFPVLSPLRNKLPRTGGQGAAAVYKRITAISGSGQGQARVRPTHGDSSTASFGGLSLQRPPKITYAADQISTTYRLQGLSDSVLWTAFWAGQGFEDIRELSNTVLLKAMMLAEEALLLGGRGTDSGLSGAYGAATVTVAAISPTGNFQGKPVTALSNATYYVKVTAEGMFGDGQASAEVNVATTAQVVQVNVTADVQGALGYKVYASTSTGAEKFIGRVGYGGTGCFIIHGGNWSTTGATVPAAADSSANDYDGICSILGKDTTTAGFYRRLNAALASKIDQIQDALFGLWDANKADPDEILANGADRRDISDIVLANSASLAYRLEIDSQNGARAGVVVASILNEITGKEIALTVHPWMPQGNLPILSYSLPVPSSEIPNVLEVRNVQDYFSVQWPAIQNTFDASIYLFGALLFYAPMFCGFIQGVKPQTP